MSASHGHARAYERAPIRERAALVVHGATHTGWVTRVGGGGLFFETPLLLERGEFALLKFRLACFDEALTVKCEVRWAARANGDQPAGLGLAFLELDPKKRQQIVEFVAERGNVLWTVSALLEDGEPDLEELRQLLRKVDMDAVTSLEDLRAKVREGMGGFFERGGGRGE